MNPQTSEVTNRDVKAEVLTLPRPPVKPPVKSEFDRALDRYRRAEVEFDQAAFALSTIIARRHTDPKRILFHGAPLADRDAMILCVKRIVADYFAMQVDDMTSSTRREAVSHPRQIAMAITREVAGLTFAEIGAAYHRDHGTVIHAVEAVRDRCAVNPMEAKKYQHLVSLCSAAVGGRAA